MRKEEKMACHDNEWTEYYQRFRYFSSDKIREGCYPRIMRQLERPEQSVVLVHGLSDSPYFMTAIGEYFYHTLGYDVYIPLLHCHGLKEPNGMEGVELEEWKANVSFAINTAASRSDRISVGGLSTGGTLGFYMATTNPQVNGTLYLFSAALDLAGGPYGLIGELKERLLRTFLADLLDNNQPLIGDNPYRYCRIDKDGAQELARLIKETDTITEGFSSTVPFPKKIFVAHSESDTTASLSGVEDLREISIKDQFRLFRIGKEFDVPHASVVLKDPVTNNGKLLEKANPQFREMLRALAEFG